MVQKWLAFVSSQPCSFFLKLSQFLIQSIELNLSFLDFTDLFVIIVLNLLLLRINQAVLFSSIVSDLTDLNFKFIILKRNIIHFWDVVGELTLYFLEFEDTSSRSTTTNFLLVDFVRCHCFGGTVVWRYAAVVRAAWVRGWWGRAWGGGRAAGRGAEFAREGIWELTCHVLSDLIPEGVRFRRNNIYLYLFVSKREVLLERKVDGGLFVSSAEQNQIFESFWEYDEHVDSNQNLHNSNHQPAVVELELGFRIPIGSRKDTDDTSSH